MPNSELAERVSTAASVAGPYADFAKDAAKGAKFAQGTKVLKVVGYGASAAGVFADGYLATHIDPTTGKPYISATQFGVNTGVTGAALWLGGPPGIFLETSYSGFNLFYNYMETNHPGQLNLNANPALWKY